MNTVHRLNEEEGISVVIITHYMSEAATADYMIVMDDGKIALSGTPREVFARGDELMTAGLDVPQVTRVAMALRDKGIAINPAVYTVDELSKELVALKRGGGRKC